MSHDANIFPEATLAEKTPGQTLTAHNGYVATVRAAFKKGRAAVRNQYLELAGEPVIKSISPVSTSKTSGTPTVFTLTGVNFSANTKVWWLGTQRTTTYVNPTQVTVSLNQPAATTMQSPILVKDGDAVSNQVFVDFVTV